VYTGDGLSDHRRVDPARSEPAGVDRFLAADERGRLGLLLAAARARLRRQPDQRDGSTGDDRS
jgi:hypothetical protein